ncbi:hypothetical protein DFH27DRAFT_550229 [Peziza echinospora]|nr:hypothetical protein DFH27DRAFT_550229 [Peziza echinospora]
MDEDSAQDGRGGGGGRGRGGLRVANADVSDDTPQQQNTQNSGLSSTNSSQDPELVPPDFLQPGLERRSFMRPKNFLRVVNKDDIYAPRKNQDQNQNPGNTNEWGRFEVPQPMPRLPPEGNIFVRRSPVPQMGQQQQKMPPELFTYGDDGGGGGGGGGFDARTFGSDPLTLVSPGSTALEDAYLEAYGGGDGFVVNKGWIRYDETGAGNNLGGQAVPESFRSPATVHREKLRQLQQKVRNLENIRRFNEQRAQFGDRPKPRFSVSDDEDDDASGNGRYGRVRRWRREAAMTRRTRSLEDINRPWRHDWDNGDGDDWTESPWFSVGVQVLSPESIREQGKYAGDGDVTNRAGINGRWSVESSSVDIFSEVRRKGEAERGDGTNRAGINGRWALESSSEDISLETRRKRDAERGDDTRRMEDMNQKGQQQGKDSQKQEDAGGEGQAKPNMPVAFKLGGLPPRKKRGGGKGGDTEDPNNEEGSDAEEEELDNDPALSNNATWFRLTPRDLKPGERIYYADMTKECIAILLLVRGLVMIPIMLMMIWAQNIPDEYEGRCTAKGLTLKYMFGVDPATRDTEWIQDWCYIR